MSAGVGGAWLLLLLPTLLSGVAGDFVTEGKWPNGEVVYEWDTNNPPPAAGKQIFLDGFAWFQENTCLKFYHKSSSEARSVSYQYEYNNLISHGESCNSHVGFRPFGQTSTNLGGRHCYRIRYTLHESLHALGMPHRQNRFDRDRFLHVYFQNITENSRFNYNKRTFDAAAVYTPYDITSIMHYQERNFAKNYDVLAMEMKDNDPDVQKILGGTKHDFPSHYDLKSVLLFYDCTSHCPVDDRCKNDGFMDKNCDCRCMDVLSGPTCEEIELTGVTNTPGCGGEYRVMLAGDSYTFSQPTRHTESNCAWFFTSELGTRMKIVFHKLSLGTYEDKLEVRHLRVGQRSHVYWGSTQNPPVAPTRESDSLNDYWLNPSITVIIRPSQEAPDRSSYDFSATITVSTDSSIRHASVSSDAEEIWEDLWYVWESSRPATETSLFKSDDQAAGGAYSLRISLSSGGTEWLQTKTMWDGSATVCVDFEYYGTGSSSTPLDIQSLRRSDRSTRTEDTITDNSHTWTSHSSTVSESDWFAVRFSYGPGSSGDMYLDNVYIKECGHVPTAPNTPPPPLTEDAFHDDFEADTFPIDKWIQEGEIGLKWLRREGETPSRDTGRISAFKGHWYAYLECSGGSNKMGSLRPITIFDGLRDLCVAFHYNMDGRDDQMGSLQLFRRDYQTKTRTEVWSNSVTDPLWHKADITIPASAEQTYVELLFVGTCGDGFRSDMAIDEVDIKSCSDSNGGGNPLPTTTTTTPLPPVTETVTLDFEDENTWDNDLTNQGTLVAPHGDYDSTEYWGRHSGSTSSSMTGPDEAHGGQYYIYMEASSPNKQYQVAELILNRVITTSEAADLNFWFHMYGKSMGELQVLVKEHNGGDEEVMWQRSESHEGWIEHSLTTETQPWPFQIMFRAIRGSGFYSDICLDDVTIIIRASEGTTNLVTTPPSHGDGPITLDFEDDYSWDSQFANQGTLSNPTNNRYYWTRNSGAPPSGTGPPAAYRGSYYIYMPARDNYDGETAELVVHHVFQKSDVVDVEFYTWIEGLSGLGSIAIYALEDGGSGENTLYYTNRANGGRQWDFRSRPSIKHQPWPFRLGFRATKWGDDAIIALDEISITTRPAVVHSPPQLPHAPPDTPGHIVDNDLLLQSFEKDLYGFRVLDDSLPQPENKWTGPDAELPLKPHSGDTMTLKTGPEKASAGNYYLLFEAAGLSAGARASLITEKNFDGDEEMCALFDYHMYGSETGKLEVLSQDLDGNETSHWQVSGKNVDAWQEANAVIPPQPEIYKIVIRVTNGHGSEGDVGLDNILVAKGPCKRITVGKHCQSCTSDYSSNTTCHGEHLDGNPYCTAFGFVEDSLWNSVNCLMLPAYKNGYVSYRKTCVLPSCSLGYNVQTDTDDVAKTLHFTTDCMSGTSLNCEICCPDHCDTSGAMTLVPQLNTGLTILCLTLYFINGYLKAT